MTDKHTLSVAQGRGQTVLATPHVASGMRRSGLAPVDALLEGGFASGEVWCVAGAPGAGKTLLALHFLTAGLAVGEPGLYITASETPARIVQFFARYWPELEAAINARQLAVLDPSPFFTELRLAKERRTRGKVDAWDEMWRFVQDATRQSRNQGARRIVIDPITPLLLAHESDIDLWDTVQTLVGALGANLGATTLLTHVALAHPATAAIGQMLAAISAGVLQLDQRGNGDGQTYIAVQGTKRRYLPLRHDTVALAVGADGHLHPTAVSLPWDMPEGIAA
jgi:KaiC/GvpD/RAD55 family RecA-like ATPase